jgi:hypothetical protein
MANTLIQLKYSLLTDVPPSLNVSEPAYSFSSNTLFIGTNDNGVINIGGYFYTSQIDNATSANTPNTLVRRDATGNASFYYVIAENLTGSLTGNADSATKLQTARFFNFTGDVDAVAVSFDGTANADFTLELTNTGVAAGTYGGQTKIPVIVVDADGRVTSAANVNVATELTIAGDDESFTVDLLTETLTINGRDGITTDAVSSNNTILIDVDNTVIRGLNGGSGSQTINSDLSVTGNLTVIGNVYSMNVESYKVTDPVIYLASNNYVSDVVDIGFVGNYFDGSSQRHTGLIRKAGTNEMYAFTNYDEEFDTNILNIANPSLVYANLHANLVDGIVENLAQAILVPDGGTGANTFASGQILVGNGTGALQSLANTGTAGTYANASHVPVITTDAYGRVSGIVNTEISIDTSQVTSGILPIARGGTNNTTYTTGALLQFDGTKVATLANSTYVQTGTLATSNTITSLTVDAYGRVTAATSQKIDIDTSQVTTGILPVVRGGTGANTFTTNGVLLGQGTSALTTVSSSTEGHILTINSSGVPQFQMLSGGTF